MERRRTQSNAGKRQQNTAAGLSARRRIPPDKRNAQTAGKRNEARCPGIADARLNAESTARAVSATSPFMHNENEVKIMKLTVSEKQCGLLYKKDKLVQVLDPGEHPYRPLWGYRAECIDMDVPELTDLPEIEDYMRFINFKRRVATINISDMQRGFLFKKGHFIQMLSPGEHVISTELGYKCVPVAVDSANLVNDPLCALYLQDEMFQAETTQVTVPDNHLAAHLIDDRLVNFCDQRQYVFWNVFETHSFQLIDMTNEHALESIPNYWLAKVPEQYCHRVPVEKHETVLYYLNGAFVRHLSAGDHFFWNLPGQEKDFYYFDLREKSYEVNGQEILTADKVTLRINVTYAYRIVDAQKLHESVKDYEHQIYVAVQLALRELVGAYRLDELLDKKSELPDLILKRLKESEERYSVEFTMAGLKDIILPGEIRDIMNTVLIAEKKAQANVIARREEVASTRSLLNTAKLMDENRTLLKLKEYEYLERICERVGTISVGNAAGMLEQLNQILGVK